MALKKSHPKFRNKKIIFIKIFPLKKNVDLFTYIIIKEILI